MPNMYSDDIDLKLDSLLSRIEYVDWNERQLLVCHLGKDDDELGAMIDQNESGLEEMSKHRNAELNALKATEFRKMLEEKGIKLITYKTLKESDGLKSMKSPLDSGY